MNNEEIKNVLLKDYFNHGYCGVIQRIVDVFINLDKTIKNQENKDFVEYKVYKEKLNIINIANEVFDNFKYENIDIYEIEEVINVIKTN